MSASKTASRPRIAFVIPTRGERPGWLEQALESVVSQTEMARIVLVAPPGAVDVSRIAAVFGVEFREQRQHGLSAAINEGWVGAHEPYCAWMGDDDLLAKDSLLSVVKALDSSARVVMAYGDCDVIDATGAGLYRMRPRRLGATFMRYGQQFIPQPGSLFRLSAVREVGGLDPSLKQAMDLDLFLKLRRFGQLMYLPEVLSAFRRHPTSLTVANINPGLEAAMVRARYYGRVARLTSTAWSPAIQFAAKAWARQQLQERPGAIWRRC